jgi:hypothetical protein
MKRLLVGLIAVAALGVVAASALAAGNGNTVWLCNGAFLVLERCLVDSENEGVTMLYDLEEHAGVECASTWVLDEGWVGPGSEDEVTSVEFMEPEVHCKATEKALNTAFEPVTNVCEKTADVRTTAIHLPWLSLLYLEGSTTLILLSEMGNGQPGYLLSCLVATVKIEDECLGHAAATPTLTAVNLEEAGVKDLVTGTFLETPAKAELAECSLKKGKEVGYVTGAILFEALEGGAAVNLETSEE